MTAPFAHGLVIGKFYPPHRGHQALIEEAARSCDQLTVLVMAARRETIALADRVAWLRELASELGGDGSYGEVFVSGVPCDAPVDYDSERAWDAQVAVMRAALGRDGRPPASAVFTSEPYGPELAKRLDAVHVPFDPARTVVPVSATKLRAGLYGRWADLIAPAQAGLAVRVVVLGAESTGTTTVAGLLAGHYRGRGGAFAATPCVPEYGRAYTVVKWDEARAAAAASGAPPPELEEVSWQAADFDAVAREQTRQEEQAARASRAPLVICDTDAFATSVWERRYLAAAARGLQPWAAAELPRHELYLLTSHEGVPWDDDGLREGDLAVRAAMTGWFAAALTRAGHSWVLLTGSLRERLALAIRATDLALADRATFAPSITQASHAE